MPNPNVDTLSAELTGVVERWFDRWQKAIAAARVANYPYQQFAADVTETYVDGAWATILPWSLLGPIQVTLTPPFPVVRFHVDAAKQNATRVVPIQSVPGSTGAKSANLRSAQNQVIPNTHVDATLAANGYLVVTIKNLGQVTAPADLYVGDVLAQPTSTVIARLEVAWPG